MFIVPCKYNSETPYIFQCAKAIDRFHPGETVVVVDSYSEDKTYWFDCNGHIEFWDIENINYGTNAFGEVYKAYPNEDFYYCIYDSLILQDNISYLEQFDVTAFRYFKTPPTGWGVDMNGRNLYTWAQEQVDWLIPQVFRGIMGPMFVASNEVMRALDEVYNIFDIKPKNKWELCAMERLYGIALENLGYDFWTHSPQGEMIDFFARYPEDKVKKINAARM